MKDGEPWSGARCGVADPIDWLVSCQPPLQPGIAIWPYSCLESERTCFPGGFWKGFVLPVKGQREMLALLFITVSTLNSIMCSSPEHFVTMRLTSKRGKNQQAKDAGTLILDLPAFRMMRDKRLLFISCPLYYTAQSN